MRRERSIDDDWFEALYRDHGDPWEFATSAYEQAKYDRTLAALPRRRYAHALEVGCANGVFTARLAPRCGSLLGIDVSETALRAARRRLAPFPQARVELARMPRDAPAGPFDLVLLSEVVYYWDRADVARLGDWLRGAVASGGDILLVHWTGDTDYPLSADEAVEGLLARLGDAVARVRAERHDSYRLDLWRRR